MFNMCRFLKSSTERLLLFRTLKLFGSPPGLLAPKAMSPRPLSNFSFGSSEDTLARWRPGFAAMVCPRLPTRSAPLFLFLIETLCNLSGTSQMS